MGAGPTSSGGRHEGAGKAVYDGPMLRSSAPLLALAMVVTPFALVTACGDADTDPAEKGEPDAASALDAGTARDGAATDGSAEDDSAEDASAEDASADAGADAPSEPEYSGEATYYYTTKLGACGIPTPPDDLVAAMNGKQYSKENCGRCAAVNGPKGSVVVRIIDKCPGCDFGDLDLSDTAFAKIAEKSAGRVKISWKFTACP